MPRKSTGVMHNNLLYIVYIFGLVNIPHFLFLGAFLASSVLLGMNQITGGSNDNIISTFIPCSIGLLLYDCTYLQESEASVILLLF